mgnify:CR=1 FL=1
MRPYLEKKIAKAKAAVEAMSPEERAAMMEAQRQSYARGEMHWPKPKFKYVNGVKVYESYEDYCNG